jgi:hypothetical protein
LLRKSVPLFDVGTQSRHLLPIAGKLVNEQRSHSNKNANVKSVEDSLTSLLRGLDEPEVKIIDVFVCKIRKKLARAGLDGIIGTVWGRGYTIQDASGGPRHSTPRLPEPAINLRRLVMA